MACPLAFKKAARLPSTIHTAHPPSVTMSAKSRSRFRETAVTLWRNHRSRSREIRMFPLNVTRITCKRRRLVCIEWLCGYAGASAVLPRKPCARRYMDTRPAKNTRTTRAIPLGRDSNVLLGKRDRMVCGLCGERIGIGDLTRDHVIPRARGGKDVWTNVVAAHRSCNMRKGCRTQRRGCHCFTFPMILAGSSTSFYLAVTSSSTRCLTW